MPAAAPTPRPPPPPARPAPPAPGHRGLCDHPLKSLSSRITERKLQGTWLPAGRGNLEKPLLGPRGSVVPVFSPQNGLHSVHVESSTPKPRVVTVVKLGGHPLRKITLLLNRRSVQNFEQLLADISESLGFPRWKNDRVRKLFNLKGREIRSVSDFFREGDAFIAMGKEPLTLKNIQVAMEELYPSKARALTLTQHSRAPSPRLRSRLHSKALRGGHHCGEMEAAKSCGEAALSKAAIRHQEAPVEPGLGDRARPQKKWGGGKWESELGGRPPREATLERPASGEKHLDVEIERTSGEIIRCDKCKRERELQQGLQRERLSLGPSELDLGKCHRDAAAAAAAAEKLGRARSCRRSPEANPAAGEGGWQGEGPRSSPRNPTQELRRPARNPDAGDEEDRDPEGQGGHAPAAKAKREQGQAPPAREGALRDARREAQEAREAPSSCRSRRGAWRSRGQPAEPAEREQEREREREREQEQEQEQERGAGPDRDPEGRPPPRGDREPRGARRRRPLGLGAVAADVHRRYEAGRVLGDGNFAVVRQCRHRQTRQAYAMKIIDKAKLRGKEDMVDSEILITRSLSHPNIVQLHEVYETEGEVYLILEYVRGGDLFDAITESVRFAEREAALLLLDLCRALAHLHDQGIVHRDLKPENLLVQRNEDKSTTLKLADFGLAKHVVRPIFTVCGTPTYVAPEILSEKGYGLEVDMWAAGVILYILLCGFPPFRSPERDQDELFNIIQLGHFEFLAPYWDNISDAAKDLVSRLLVVDPKKRYTAHQVLQHPWIETAGKTSMVNLQKEMPSSNEGHVRSQHKRPAEQAL